MIDIIDRTVSSAKLTEQLSGFDDVLWSDCARIERNVEAELLVQLVATNAT